MSKQKRRSILNAALEYPSPSRILRHSHLLGHALREVELNVVGRSGKMAGKIALHNDLADLLHASGRSEAAMEHLKQAVTIFAEIGSDAGNSEPEIRKLVEW